MSRALNIQDRAGFFDDPFFRDSWHDFDSAIQRVFDRFDDPSGIHRSSSSASSHHQGSMGDRRRQEVSQTIGTMEEPYASQALQVVEKDGRFQVVMDVKDFNPRNLQVRAVEDNRIVVEGKYQQMSEDGSSSSWKTFSKEFTLPEEADIDLVTTALSKDGILTVKAPKKANCVPSQPKPKSNTVQSIKESYDQHVSGDNHSTRSFKSTSSSTASSFKSGGSKTLQSSSSFESCDSGLDSLPRDVRERLMLSESGMSSVSNSNSSCSSPVPSEAPSDVSRVSTTMEFDIGNNLNKNTTSRQRSEVTFNVEAAEKNRSREASERPLSQASSSDNTFCRESSQASSSDNAFCRESSQASSSDNAFCRDTRVPTPTRFDRRSLDKTEMYPAPTASPVFMSPATRVPTFTPGCGSIGDKTVTVEEKDGRRTVKAERSNVIQEKDGLMESHEITAEVDEKDGQSARREAVTRIQRQNDDPNGRFKEAEKAEASDVSESCIKQLPDGSKVSVKKSSTSSSSHRTFSSTGNNSFDDAFDDPFFSVGFSSDFGDLRSLMGRGHSLMSQMSTDSVGSTMSGRSNASRMSDQSRLSSRSDASRQSNTSFRSQQSDESSQSRRSFDRSRLADDFPSRQSSLRDQFGSGLSDRSDSMFSHRSMLSNRPSLAERFPSFSDALAEFDDMHSEHFSDFPSMNSRMSSRSSNMSNSSFSSFGSHFDDKF